jgi:branched-chain amino acid transport system permease protein
LASTLGVDPLLALPVVALGFGFAGWFLQPLIGRVVAGDRPLPVLMGLVFTFGVAILLQALAFLVWGINRRSMASDLVRGTVEMSLLGASVLVPILRLLVLAFGLAVVLGIGIFMRRTRYGAAVRAVAQNATMAALLGVDVERLGRAVYAGYTAITAGVGIFVGILFAVSPEVGLQYTTFAFFTVVLAGMGYVAGVPVAGLALGLLQSGVAVYWGPRYVYLAVFLALYLTLLMSPRGLLRKGWA